MTFSLMARCPDTGAFGAAIATSNMALGPRCVRLAHGVGAFLSQHRTDPRLGDAGLALLGQGMTAAQAIKGLSGGGAADMQWRQLAALDAKGSGAAFHGGKIYSIHGHSLSENCLALGNLLASDQVTARMLEGFEQPAGTDLAERLLRGLEAGLAAGGEVSGPIISAGLRVSGENGLDACDLRIDYAATNAVADLRTLYDRYQPEAASLRQLALAPDDIPVSRALFEASIERIAKLGLGDQFPAGHERDRWKLRD